MAEMGQYLPHHLTERAAALPHKAAALTVRHRGSYGPLATFRIAENCPRSAANLLTRDEAFLIAVNIAKLPSMPRQILKDIPRPPNSASRDD
jgi:hypothetical protein